MKKPQNGGQFYVPEHRQKYIHNMYRRLMPSGLISQQAFHEPTEQKVKTKKETKSEDIRRRLIIAYCPLLLVETNRSRRSAENVTKINGKRK